MAKSLDQRSHVAHLDAELAAVAGRTRALAASLEASPALASARPPTAGWTVAEIFEHLVISTGSYLAMLRGPIRSRGPGGRAVEEKGGSAREWKPSFMGGLLLKSLRSKRKLPAPAIWRGVAEPREAVIDRFLEQVAETRILLRDSETIDWRSVRLHSPASRLIRLNMGDALTIVTVHASRHLGQAERTLAAVQGAAERESSPPAEGTASRMDSGAA